MEKLWEIKGCLFEVFHYKWPWMRDGEYASSKGKMKNSQQRIIP